MERLRRPFFIAALALIAVVLLVEVGAGLLGGAGDPASMADLERYARAEGVDFDRDAVRRVSESEDPPGLAIGYLALVDGLLLFTIGLIGLSLLVRERIQARIQGILTLVFSVLLVLLAIGLIFFALGKLLVMIALLTATPFGTLAYLAIYGFFERAGASAVLGLLMVLKIAFVFCLVLAQQRFLQNRGLVFLILTSFLCGLIVSFLHGLVPLFLVSITDAVAAIIVAVIAVIWAVVVLVGSIRPVWRALRLDRV